MNIKEDFHHLIDSIEDEQFLKSCFELFQKISNGQNGHLWNGLSEAEKRELLASYEESFDSKNLLSHEDIKVQHEKWLRP